MNDAYYAALFILIFAVLVVIYGAILAHTGNVELLPLRAQLSISGPEDVKRVGVISARVGLVLAALSLVAVITQHG
jgi:hypothetical protein